MSISRQFKRLKLEYVPARELYSAWTFRNVIDLEVFDLPPVGAFPHAPDFAWNRRNPNALVAAVSEVGTSLGLANAVLSLLG